MLRTIATESAPEQEREPSFAEPAPGDVVAEKYELARVLGRGGVGIVFEAKNRVLGERVALKVLSSELAANPRVVARFLREARAAASIRSEHVVRVFDVGTLESGVPFIVMEYLEGSDLLALVRARGPLPVAEAAAYVLQACEAIAEAHALGLVHRDLKSANLFVTSRADGSACVKVLDFGISKVPPAADGADPALTHTTETDGVIGSPAYMPPEQILFPSEVDARADIWSLGTVLEELVCGERPFAGSTKSELLMKVLHEPPRLPSALRDDLPAGLDAVVAKCLEKNRADRYANVAELAEALAPFAAGEAVVSVARARRIVGAAPEAADARPKAETPARRSKLSVAILVAASMGVGAVAAWALTRGSVAPPPVPSATPPVVAEEAPVTTASIPPLPSPSPSPEPPPAPTKAAAPAHKRTPPKHERTRPAPTASALAVPTDRK